MGKGQWQFEGGGFHESLPEGRTAGTLEVSPVSVKFVSDAGTVEMPVSGLQMELGGSANRMLFLKHSEQPGLDLFHHGPRADGASRVCQRRTHSRSPQFCTPHQMDEPRLGAHFLGIVVAIALGLWWAKDPWPRLWLKRSCGNGAEDWRRRLLFSRPSQQTGYRRGYPGGFQKTIRPTSGGR